MGLEATLRLAWEAAVIAPGVAVLVVYGTFLFGFIKRLRAKRAARE